MNNPETKHCMKDLTRLFQLMPLSKYKSEISIVEERERSREPLSPLATLKRPPSNILLRKSLRQSQAQSTSRSLPASPQTVADQVKQMEQIREREMRSKMTVRDKLENFKSNFCNSKLKALFNEHKNYFLPSIFSVFCKNHESYRLLGFDSWCKVFYENIDDILDDMKEYYESLPHTEGKKFDQEKIRTQFHSFLFKLYEDTKKGKVSSVLCKELVGDRLEASAEIGRMKKLKQGLTSFIEYVQQLLEPFVLEVESSADVRGTFLSPKAPKSRLPTASRSTSSLNLSGPSNRVTAASPNTKISLGRKTLGSPQAASTPKPQGSPKTPTRPTTAPSLSKSMPGQKKLTRVEELKKQNFTPARVKAAPQASSTPFSANIDRRNRKKRSQSEKSVRERVEEALTELSIGDDFIVKTVESHVHRGLINIVKLCTSIRKNFCQGKSSQDSSKFKLFRNSKNV